MRLFTLLFGTVLAASITLAQDADLGRGLFEGRCAQCHGADGNGGDMGMISESQLRTNPEIYTAVSKLKPGEVSHPLPMVEPNSKRAIGYSIIRLNSKEPAGQRELNDPRVQQFIREQLRDSREQLLKAAYYDVLHNEAKIQNYYAADLLKNVQ